MKKGQLFQLIALISLFIASSNYIIFTLPPPEGTPLWSIEKTTVELEEAYIEWRAFKVDNEQTELFGLRKDDLFIEKTKLDSKLNQISPLQKGNVSIFSLNYIFPIDDKYAIVQVQSIPVPVLYIEDYSGISEEVNEYKYATEVLEQVFQDTNFEIKYLYDFKVTRKYDGTHLYLVFEFGINENRYWLLVDLLWTNNNRFEIVK